MALKRRVVGSCSKPQAELIDLAFEGPHVLGSFQRFHLLKTVAFNGKPSTLNLVPSVTMSRIYVGNLDPRVTERELEDEFRVYGVIRSIWVARKPPGYAFIDFDDRRDAQDAIRELDGKNGWRVELSHNSRGYGGGGRGGGGRSGGSDLKCYECGEPGHFARECRSRVGSGRRRSRSPRYRRSPSYGHRSYSPRGRSPRRRSLSPYRGRYSKSPTYRAREDSPYANGHAIRGRRRSRS